ncbi:hydroxymethylglutaryl-CoA lyase [Dactylosporangium vinaceum]|uniref:Hydroxymethylglutaryl-CoA lyase n=1 Tax=Dactylosporangium vinaceum TaxID=53362 RepID=A0ABV5M298_9ACTN|nr:hydroxymethylglutaryl-CoA lyase [Dactylosporangium vinaceum]UAB99359.1 hydroxymethylglutaryl-CoA lyase [Dactylosporangium vinaceum]
MRVEIVEVGPRDGLQNEAVTVPTGVKVEFVRRLAAAGARRIEVTSFVRPDRVPQLADAEEVLAGVADLDVAVSALVFNERGLRRARAAAVAEVNLVLVATDSFSMRNQGAPVAAAMASSRRLAEQARDAGLRVTLTVGAAWGCPFEGEVDPAQVLRIVEGVPDVDEVCVADTIGVGTPGRITSLLGAVRGVTDRPLRCHFHNTRNSGYANAYAAIAAGAVALDASSGGIGGCPFAPRATGNIATEDLAWALGRDGYETGLSLPGLLDAAALVERTLGRQVPAQLGRTDPFPPGAGASSLGSTH